MAKVIIKQHGIGVLIKRVGKKLFIEIDMIGKLTDEDYRVMIPMVERALKEAKGLEVNLLVDMTAFKGWDEFKAMLDEIKFAFKHINDFKKIAVVGKKKREGIAIKIWSFLSKAKVKFFTDKAKAIAWLLKDD